MSSTSQQYHSTCIRRRIYKIHKNETDSDIYDECPTAPEGFEYDKDYYLSSTLYSNFIDNEIKKYKIDKKNK
jgi:hypothetical protein